MRKRQIDSLYLTPLTGKIKRKKFLTVDIESKKDDTQEAGFTRPFLVGIYDPLGHEYVEFRDEPHLRHRHWQSRYAEPGGCVDKALNFLLQPRFKNYNFYAHNGGSFDHLFWLAWLRRNDVEFGFEVVPVQSSIQKIDVWAVPDEPEEKPSLKWTFLDSMKLLPMGLDKACKTFGLPGKVKHDLDMHEDDERWSVYLKQDCMALAEVLERTHELIEGRLGGEVGMTAPSTAMKLFRHAYMGKDGTPTKIPRHAHFPECKNKEQCSGCCHEWVRRGYYGGRTELFKAYGEKLHYYDINSSYVAAMQEDMPAGDRMVTSDLKPEMDENYVGFVECIVYVPHDCPLPPLPFRHEKTGKLVFPTGRFAGIWDYEELKLLDDPLVKGRIERVRKVVWYRRKPLFGPMMRNLWELRDKTRDDYDEGLSALAKLMGNSLYGKFGMKQERTTIAFTQEGEGKCLLCPKQTQNMLCDECDGSKPADLHDPACDVWYQAKTVDAPYIIPQIAAHITSLARVRIWRFMKQALSAGGDVYYCDTDSVITDAILPSSSALGALKDEYPGKELRGTFVQPKVYMLECDEGFDEPGKTEPEGGWPKSKVTMKGFPRKLRTKENLQRLRNKETLSYDNLERVRTLARGGFLQGPKMREVKKSFKSEYDKRKLLADGTTEAIILDQGFQDEELAWMNERLPDEEQADIEEENLPF